MELITDGGQEPPIPEGRRAHLTVAGESLATALGEHDIVDLLYTRVRTFEDETGLEHGQYLSTPLAAVPFPYYFEIEGDEPGEGEYDPRRQFPHVKASALWHPMFWLPRWLSDMWQADDDTYETEDEYAMRLVWALTSSQLYDEETGSWLDVLAAVGYDTANPEHLREIEAWQDGAPNERLDTIDLSEWLEGIDRTDALESVVPWLHGAYYPAAWAALANDLIETFEPIRSPIAGESQRDLHDTARMLMSSSIRCVGIAPDRDFELRSQAWVDAASSLTDAMTCEQIRSGPLSTAFELLHDTHLQYQQSHDALIEAHRMAAAPLSA